MEYKFLSLAVLVLAPLIPIFIILSPVFSRSAVIVRRFAKWFAGIHFVYACCFLMFFNPNLLSMSYKNEIVLFNSSWLKTMGISASFAIDGLSLILCVLTTFIFLIAFVVSKYSITEKHKFYYSLMFLLETSALGVFCAKDVFLIFLFWVLSGISLYFLISNFGNSKEEADKYFTFINTGNMFLLLGILILYYYSFSVSGILTADIEVINFDELANPIWLQILTFTCFLIGFCSKFPIFPLHSFSSKVQENSPMPVNIILSSVIFSMGAYGLIKFNMQFFPTTFKTMALVLMFLAVTGIIHCSMSAFVQTNIKRIIYYLSCVFANFILLGLTTVTISGIKGAIFMIFSSGLIFCALYLITGIIYLRTKSLDIRELGGISKQMTRLMYFSVPVCLAVSGIPFFIMFPPEIMIISGAFLTELLDEIPFQIGAIITILALLPIAAVVIKFLHNIFFGNILTKYSNIKDVSMSEFISLSAITIPVLILGFVPNLLTNLYDTYVLLILDILRI